MDISVLLAKFWGWYMLIFFFVLSVKPIRIKQIFQDFHDQKFALLASFMAFVLGLVNILLHNIWEASWIIIISILGWLALGLGIILFIMPHKAARWLIEVNTKMIQVLYIILFLLGLYLLNMAYQILIY